MQKKLLNSSHFSKLLVLLIGFVLFIWTLKLSYEKQKIEANLSIEKQLNQYIYEVTNQLTTSVEALYALADLIKTFPTLDAKQFQTFTQSLSSRKKNILILEWQPRIKGEDRIRFLEDTKQLGYPQFTLVEPGPDSSLMPARARAEHYPVLFAISTRGHESTIGLDLAWSPERMESKYKARDIALPVASKTFNIELVKGNERFLPGFAISLPVYRTKTIPDSLKERRNKLKGYVAAVIYLDELFNPMLQKLSEQHLGLKITNLADQIVMTKPSGTLDLIFTKSKIIDIYGNKWKFEILATEQFFKQFLQLQNFFISFSLLIFLIALLLLLFQYEIKNKQLSLARAELQNAYDSAKAAAKSKMIFLANMSHEIRTPMNAILGYAKLIKVESNNHIRNDYINKMMASGNHLLNVINDILDLSSLEESKLKLHPQKFEISSLIKQVNDMIATKYSLENIDYSSELYGCDGVFYGDSIRLRQILLNILGNAIKFTERGTIYLSCHIKSEKQEFCEVEFQIKDTGIGMDEKYLTQIFQPFTQEEESFTRSKGGTGLGLSIAYSLVQLMGGTIKVDSKKSVGTIFTIILPLIKIPEATVDEQYVENETTDLLFTHTKNILVAEDDEDARFLIQAFFKGYNFQIDFVMNGRELVEKACTQNYDLILTDIQMPELDGLSAAKILREKGIQVPILALSAHALVEEKEKSYEAGINAHITKPLDQKELINTIKAFL